MVESFWVQGTSLLNLPDADKLAGCQTSSNDTDRSMKRRVVVTGMGCITPVGNTVESMWKSLQECASGIGPLTYFDASTFPTKFASQVKNYNLGDYVPNPERYAHCGRNIQFAIGAATQAMKDSGLEDKDVEPPRFGVYLGSGEGQQDFPAFLSMIAQATQADGTLDYKRFTELCLETLVGEKERQQEPNMTAAHLAALFNAQGPNLNCLTACAASSQAMGEATELIRHGDADVMLTGGAHSMIHGFGVTGFNLLTALSTRNDDPRRASRPFDRDRDGFVLGEGAGMLVLEELEHAKRRGAKIYGEVAGYGSSADSYRITDIHPEGRGAATCIKMAMDDAGVNPDEIDYINAHGTSTAVNDRTETMAIKRALGDAAYRTPVSSTKSMMGHLIAAAGAVEAITCLLAICDDVLPPTINYETPDPDCDLDYIPNQPREGKAKIALSNSFGFGGQNVSLILKEFRG
jgi:3-oxoacyl-[acyl-carrier-protein] synthase II